MPNTAHRDFCGLDTLAASQVLRRLRDRHLLDKQGAGSRTYYSLHTGDRSRPLLANQQELPLDIPTSQPNEMGHLENPHKLNDQSPQALVGIPEKLLLRIQAAGKKPRQAVVRDLLRELCTLRAYTAQELCQILGRRDSRELTRLHLKPMREAGILTLQYPESEKHPLQAYRISSNDSPGEPQA